MVKMGEILGAFPHGLSWIVLCPLKGTEIQHFTKHCASRTMCVCRKPGFSLGTQNLQPFETTHLFNPVKSLHTTYFGIHFGMFVNNRHLIRYHLKNDTCFIPRKVWNGEILHTEGTEFKAEWDQRSWAEEEKRGLGEPVANSSPSSQGEIKSGLSAQC